MTLFDFVIHLKLLYELTELKHLKLTVCPEGIVGIFY